MKMFSNRIQKLVNIKFVFVRKLIQVYRYDEKPQIVDELVVCRRHEKLTKEEKSRENKE